MSRGRRRPTGCGRSCARPTARPPTFRSTGSASFTSWLSGELLHGPAFRLDGLLLAADTIVEALIASDGSDERFAALLFLVNEAREVVEDIIVRLESAGRTAEIAGGG